jgi:exopolysaccharide biosynthesis polyprenyl glycosylphosphotransferase
MFREQYGQMASDLFLTAIAFGGAFAMRLALSIFTYPPGTNFHFPFLLLITMVCCGLSYHYSGIYEFRGRHVPFDKIFLRVAKSISLGAAGTVLLLYLVNQTAGTHLLMLLFFGLDLLLLSAYRADIHLRRKQGLNRREILVVGSRERARELIGYVAANKELGYHLIGCLEVSPDLVGTEVAEGVTVIGVMEDFRGVLLERAVDEIIFALPLVKVENVLDYISFAEELGVNVRILPDWQIPELMYQPKVASVFIDQFVGLPTLAVSSVPHQDLALLVKYLLDYCLAAIGLLALLPLFAVLAVLIKLTSTGPIFFRQERVGLNGRKFMLYKFRTMVPDAEKLKASLLVANEVDGPVFKIENDPRLTKIGKILRKTSLDELPQLINVLRGEMSLVGPRPPLAEEVAKYSHWQRRRLSMKPGITCIWQVNGRNEVRFEEWMRMDLEYIDKWSLLLDFKILLQTIPSVLLGTGK